MHTGPNVHDCAERKEWTEGLLTQTIEGLEGWQGKEGGRDRRVEYEKAGMEGSDRLLKACKPALVTFHELKPP